MSAPLLEMKGMTKAFPGVKALDGVSLDLNKGEIHALVGENGAGKSTLIKILAGVYPHPEYGGDITLDGSVRHFANVRDAANAGIAVIYQELSLVKDLSVAENICLGREPRRFGIINWEELYSRAQKLLNELHLEIDPLTPVCNLGIGQQQLVEIAKALSQDARILVLDEPTAALTDAEVETLFEILRNLRSRGVAMIYISHKLDEVFRLGDRITVLRDGRTVGTDAARDLDEGRVIAKMVGREVDQIFPKASRDRGDVVFEARHVTVEDPAVPGKLLVDQIGFTARKGEVLGIAGLMGSGRSELLMAIFGAHPGRKSAEIFVDGQSAQINQPSDAIRQGIGFVTEDRKRYGLILDQTILKNMTLAGLRKLSGRLLSSIPNQQTFRSGQRYSLKQSTSPD